MSRSVKALLAKGANPNATLTKGSPVRRFGSQWALPTPISAATPLFVAATYLEVELMRALLAAGAKPMPRSPTGRRRCLPPPASPSRRKRARPISSRWNVVDNDTPVVPRPRPTSWRAVTLLLDAGADVNQANAAGDTALHARGAANRPLDIELLADRGATLNVKNKAGQTPLALTLPRRPAGAASAGARAQGGRGTAAQARAQQ